MRAALAVSTLHNWCVDVGEADSPSLIKQLRKRLLGYRGISAAPKENLITSGAQNVISLLGTLNAYAGRSVAIEDPCYPEAHLRRMQRRYKSRGEIMLSAVTEYLPEFDLHVSQGGTFVWLTGPEGLDSTDFSLRLQHRGILTDEGSMFYRNLVEGKRKLRLGFAALSRTAITPRIEIIAQEASGSVVSRPVPLILLDSKNCPSTLALPFAMLHFMNW